MRDEHDSKGKQLPSLDHFVRPREVCDWTAQKFDQPSSALELMTGVNTRITSVPDTVNT